MGGKRATGGCIKNKGSGKIVLGEGRVEKGRGWMQVKSWIGNKESNFDFRVEETGEGAEWERYGRLPYPKYILVRTYRNACISIAKTPNARKHDMPNADKTCVCMYWRM